MALCPYCELCFCSEICPMQFGLKLDHASQVKQSPASRTLLASMPRWAQHRTQDMAGHQIRRKNLSQQFSLYDSWELSLPFMWFSYVFLRYRMAQVPPTPIIKPLRGGVHWVFNWFWIVYWRVKNTNYPVHVWILLVWDVSSKAFGIFWMQYHCSYVCWICLSVIQHFLVLL